MRTSPQSRNYNGVRIKTLVLPTVEKVQLSEKTFYQIMVFFRPESSACEAAYKDGETAFLQVNLIQTEYILPESQGTFDKN